MGARLGLLLLSTATLTACAHKPIDVTGCNLPMTRLAVAEPPVGAPGLETVQAPGGYAALVAAAMAPPDTESVPGPDRAPPQRAVSLFLSGGGQNGAFGAGFIDQWRIGGGGTLPAFRVVTGVSTGALIGTTAFTGDSQRTVAGYTIASEADLVDVKARGLLAQVRAGAAGTLDPLRRRLAGILDDQLLGDIAAADASGRKFLVGVVDVREGDAWAIDMTALASRWVAESDAAKRVHIKQCYVEALVASASAPFAAPPVYIDGRMLIDGGARFGVFRAAEADGLAMASDRARAMRAPPPVSFLIVNGTLAIGSQCATKATATDPCPANGALKDWSIIDLGLRSVDILTNQVYRFSADSAAAGPGDHHFVRIDSDEPAHVYDGKACSDWRTVDDTDKPPPVQFHKREMLCLIDYGRIRANAERWWEKD